MKEAGFNAQDGNFIRIDHGNGQETFYAHCEKLLVKIGDAVELGRPLPLSAVRVCPPDRICTLSFG